MSDSIFQFKLAKTPEEINAYFQLRRKIFCEEQQLFEGDDLDEVDNYAYPIVAMEIFLDGAEKIVGVVRIYEMETKRWYGGRLGVHRDYRRKGSIGKELIYKAVTTANTWGCNQFLATVQLQNVRFFSPSSLEIFRGNYFARSPSSPYGSRSSFLSSLARS